VIRFIVRRLLVAIPTLLAISFVTFVVIELPQGDFLDSRMAELRQVRGDVTSLQRADELRVRYGLDKPFYWRYGKWISGVVRGDFGESFRWEREVSSLIGERIGWTLVVSLGTMLFIWSLAVPLGIWTATKSESRLARAVSAVRIMRGNMLEVLGEPFVRTARAKGLPERVVLLKHAARVAVNPLISILGMSLPDVLSGTTIVSVVLGLPTVGPLLLQALIDQDMYLAGTILLFMAALLVAGNLLADLALAWADPRIRHA
jgi:ABC-type dipeptide/oligopeptide/nickel transport system permease component